MTTTEARTLHAFTTPHPTAAENAVDERATFIVNDHKGTTWTLVVHPIGSNGFTVLSEADLVGMDGRDWRNLAQHTDWTPQYQKDLDIIADRWIQEPDWRELQALAESVQSGHVSKDEAETRWHGAERHDRLNRLIREAGYTDRDEENILRCYAMARARVLMSSALSFARLYPKTP